MSQAEKEKHKHPLALSIKHMYNAVAERTAHHKKTLITDLHLFLHTQIHKKYHCTTMGFSIFKYINVGMNMNMVVIIQYHNREDVG